MEIKNIDTIFLEAVKENINNFNKTRGKRKELSPKFVDRIPGRGKKFGRILDMSLYTEDDEIQRLYSEVVPKIAKMVIRTLLTRKPRPGEMVVGILPCSDNRRLFRIILPMGKHNNNHRIQ